MKRKRIRTVTEDAGGVKTHTFKYKCENFIMPKIKCGHIFETLDGKSDNKKTCPACGSENIIKLPKNYNDGI